MTGERLLDASWTRVEAFNPTGPSSRSKSKDDVMDMDGGEEEGEGGGGSEWEYEDTEELVTLDLGSESKRLFQMSHQYSITGLETNEPFLRLGNLFFKGHWDQLLGTEIILKDEKDSTKPVPFQHDVRPLQTTDTDIRTGRAPSTTRNRIQFRPAANLAARQKLLRESGDPSNTNLVSHKNWVWIRGRGWIRKELVNLVDGEEEVKDEEVQEVDREVADGNDNTAQPETSLPPQPKKKMGRKKMTEEERLRQSFWTSLKKIDQFKNQESRPEDEEALDGSNGGENSRSRSQEEPEHDEGENDE